MEQPQLDFYYSQELADALSRSNQSESNPKLKQKKQTLNGQLWNWTLPAGTDLLDNKRYDDLVFIGTGTYSDIQRTEETY